MLCTYMGQGEGWGRERQIEEGWGRERQIEEGWGERQIETD